MGTNTPHTTARRRRHTGALPARVEEAVRLHDDPERYAALAVASGFRRMLPELARDIARSPFVAHRSPR